MRLCSQAKCSASIYVSCPGHKIMVERTMYCHNRGAGTGTTDGFAD